MPEPVSKLLGPARTTPRYDQGRLTALACVPRSNSGIWRWMPTQASNVLAWGRSSHRVTACRTYLPSGSLDTGIHIGQSASMSGELRVVLVAAITSGQAVVAVRCIEGDVGVGDWVEHVADSHQAWRPARAEVMSIMRLNVEMSDEDLTRAGAEGPDAYQGLEHEDAEVLEGGGTALVLLRGPISNLDGALLATTSM
jgi:hypothetical protein